MKNRWRLVLTLFTMLSVEFLFRGLEASSSGDTMFNHFFYDEKVRRKGLIEDGGVFHPNYEMRVNQRGFRDAKYWPPEHEASRRRIFVGAAGHGYGENLTDEDIYVQQLEKKLNQQSTIPIDVFNLSVQGSTVLFFERALLEEVLQSKPDVVILSYSGFNEALRTTLPEADVLFPKNNVYNLAMSSATIRTIRQWVGSFWGTQFRVSPDEMIESYTRITNALHEAEIDVLILQQLVIFPDIEGLWKLSDVQTFRQKLQEFSLKKEVKFVDPLPYCPDLQNCFEQMEWYSAIGHKAILRSLEPHYEWLSGEQ